MKSKIVVKKVSIFLTIFFQINATASPESETCSRIYTQLMHSWIKKSWPIDVFFESLRTDGKLEMRVKSESSLAIKLKNKNAGGDPADSLLKLIGDGLGYRYQLANAQEERFETIVRKIEKFMANQDGMEIVKAFNVVEISNLHGPGIKPYLSDGQIERLIKAHNLSNNKHELKVVSGIAAERPEGYTSLHLILLLRDGIKVEIQFRGSNIQRVATVNHFFYDIEKGKAIPEHFKTDKLTLIAKTYKSLSNTQKVSFKSYFKSLYGFMRKQEQILPIAPIRNLRGRLDISDALNPRINVPLPQRPADLPEILDFVKIEEEILIAEMKTEPQRKFDELFNVLKWGEGESQ